MTAGKKFSTRKAAPQPAKPRADRRSRARMLLAAAGVALVLGGGATLAVSTVAAQPAPSYAVQAAAPRYPAAPMATPTANAAAPEATPSAPPSVKPTGRLTISSVGLDAPLLHMAVPADGALDPATRWDAYLVDGYGTPAEASSGTVFVVMHSGRGETQALGNALVNRDTGHPALAVGAQLEVDGVMFAVTGSRVVAKGSLHDQADLWNGSHALAVITCQQYADGSPSENSVTFAERS